VLAWFEQRVSWHIIMIDLLDLDSDFE
jgi:hypothetical protein